MNNMHIKLNNIIKDHIQQLSTQRNCTVDELCNEIIYSYLETINFKNKKSSKLELPIPIESLNKLHLDMKTPINISDIKLNHPFINLSNNIIPQSIIRNNITNFWYCEEEIIIPYLLEQLHISSEISSNINILATELTKKIRVSNKKNINSKINLVQNLLQEFSLSSKEGITLMCLAEALLRIPDNNTKDLLIYDKICNKDWISHLGNKSILVNLATRGLIIVNKLISNQYNRKNKKFFGKNFINKNINFIIRKSINTVMQLIGKQFVTGSNINLAIKTAGKLEKNGFRYSYDILGEAALTNHDALSYTNAYQEAIHIIGKHSNGLGIYNGPGISIKLSALYPRYCRSQYKLVMTELYPRLLLLTLLAKKYDIGLNIDAEESSRLEISLDLLIKLCYEPELSGWNGIGFVVQAYQKRSIKVIDELIQLAKSTKRRLMIRLVKGAYWDSEIKNAQVYGLNDYPVFTRKIYTDLSYLVCAKKLLSVPKYIYPQFATHNAYTLSAVYYLAGQNYYEGQYEFQCLHGMGETLYNNIVNNKLNKLSRPCRIYAPVGSYNTLLSYLVRRLLENGANTSFINQVADHSIPIENLIINPIEKIISLKKIEGKIGLSNPKIPSPRNLYNTTRINSLGLDINNEQTLTNIIVNLLNENNLPYQVKPIISSDYISEGITYQIVNPANNHDIVGTCQESSLNDVNKSIAISKYSSKYWVNKTYHERAIILNKAADLIEKDIYSFIGLLIREAGKTITNAISEIREAIDFLRYYAYQANNYFDNNYYPLGIVVCISPWNFPLAIFIGQIAAALVVGNTVIAKPAEQTPIIASKVVKVMFNAGVPDGVLQLLPGKGKIIGPALVNNDLINGIMFTGSTKVAKFLQNTLFSRIKDNIVPIIAETGGINTMIVDSSALIEQAVLDIIQSAFDSAGQRCSALRLLCLQNDIADLALSMLKGAILEYKVGDPSNLSTDIGPVISNEAKLLINSYIDNMRKNGYVVWQNNNYCNNSGSFVTPTIIELDSVDQLNKEIFGPVLHIIRYDKNELNNIIKQINCNGYGLTFGLQTRIEYTTNNIVKYINAGNCYINRNIIGAVVGVQPFGGEKLSGTGPKAGGPLYLYRLVNKRNNLTVPNIIKSLNKISFDSEGTRYLYNILCDWIRDKYPNIINICNEYNKISNSGNSYLLEGPTGELNKYKLLPRKYILCVADQEIDLVVQLIAVFCIGSYPVLISNLQSCSKILKILPELIKNTILVINDWSSKSIIIDTIIIHSDNKGLNRLIKFIKSSTDEEPLINIQNYNFGDHKISLERLLLERTISVNTTAIGGNTTLITQ
ncbi:MAG: trifunctional transcriptional regulator/proline dehydrogenase/L-glutamate gamma-semialdehyde dehydrogenase [Candidatus Lightella neohaematopini]|nr:trifunctional transcriptional regulator/proline dehydrogenase/L-glutamate gamma-semialdehyde dehydrogenase [Candidatus Lightella neohaematopini]